MAIYELANSGGDELPPGAYSATFTGLTPCVTERGKALRWAFTLDDGRKFSDLSDADSVPTPKNRTGRFLAGLIGKPPTAGLRVDPDTYVGQRYLIVVEANDKGRSKLTTLTAVPIAVLPTIPTTETPTGVA